MTAATAKNTTGRASQIGGVHSPRLHSIRQDGGKFGESCNIVAPPLSSPRAIDQSPFALWLGTRCRSEGLRLRDPEQDEPMYMRRPRFQEALDPGDGRPRRVH